MKVCTDILLLIKSYLPLYEMKQTFGKKDFYKVVKIGNYPKIEIFQNLKDFTTSCSDGDLDLVQIYLKYGYIPAQTDIYWAIYGGNLDVVKYLYEECKLKPDRDALITAVNKKFVNILNYFNKIGLLDQTERYYGDYEVFEKNYQKLTISENVHITLDLNIINRIKRINPINSAFTKLILILFYYSIYKKNTEMANYFISLI